MNDTDDGPGRAVDTGLSSLALLLRHLGRPADLDQLSHRFGAADGRTDAVGVVRAGRQSGVKIRLATSRWDRLGRLALPAMAELRDGGFVVLVKAASDRVLILDPRERQNKTLARAEFEAIWSGRLILVATRAALAAAERRFDFTWFIPAVVKHRRLFGRGARGLALPAALRAGLAALLPGGDRQGARPQFAVDAGRAGPRPGRDRGVRERCSAGSGPMSSRTPPRASTSSWARGSSVICWRCPCSISRRGAPAIRVARVRELENIRNFLTSSAMTLVIDLLFTVVFLAVMFMFSRHADLDRAGLASRSMPPCPFAVTPIFRRRLDEKFKRGAENQAFLVETVSGVETLKAMAVEPQMQRRWEEQLAGYVRADFSVRQLGKSAEPGGAALSKLATAAVLFFGAQAVIDGNLTVGELVAFNMLAGRVSATGAAAGAALAGFPAGAASRSSGSATSSTRRPKPGFRPGRTALPPARGADQLRACRLPLSAATGRRCCSRSRLDDPGRPDGRHRRPLGLRQDHAHQAGAAALCAGKRAAC